VYCVVRNADVPVAGQSERSRVVCLNVEILDYYVFHISRNGSCDIFQLNLVLYNDSHSHILPSDRYRGYY